jgi:hypothetical protein
MLQLVPFQCSIRAWFAADEPLETRPSGAPAVPDPQAGLVDDSPIDEPEAAAPTHPRLGGPIGP